MLVSELITILESYEPNDVVVIDLDHDDPFLQDLYDIQVDDITLNHKTLRKEVRLNPKN